MEEEKKNVTPSDSGSEDSWTFIEEIETRAEIHGPTSDDDVLSEQQTADEVAIAAEDAINDVDLSLHSDPSDEAHANDVQIER